MREVSRKPDKKGVDVLGSKGFMARHHYHTTVCMGLFDLYSFHSPSLDPRSFTRICEIFGSIMCIQWVMVFALTFASELCIWERGGFRISHFERLLTVWGSRLLIEDSTSLRLHDCRSTVYDHESPPCHGRDASRLQMVIVAPFSDSNTF